MVSKALQDQIKRLLSNPAKVCKLKTESGRTVEEILRSEANRLKDLIQQEINILYSKPQGWYPRTNAFRKALDDNISVDPKTNTIEITFNRDLAEHNSWITKTFDPSYDKKSFVPLAMNEGFKIFNGGYFEGTHYIENAVSKFNKNKHAGIKVWLVKTYNSDTYYDNYL